MKFPRLLCSITLFSLMQLTAVEAQVLSTPKLNSTLGNTSVINTCNPGTVTFTVTGDSGPNALDVEFRINRGGTIIYPLGASGPQPITTFSTNTLQDGDIVYARVWTYDNGGGDALTNSITFDIDAFPGPIDFSSDAPNNTICNDEIVSFTASSIVSTTLFQYFINGISIHGPSTQTTFTHLITDVSTVTLLASDNSCERRVEIRIDEIVLLPGSVTGGGQLCNGDTPTAITSVNSATHNGNFLGVLTPNTNYQWQSSFDGTNWFDILEAQGHTYSPPALNQSTYFRRTVQYNHLGNQCDVASNQIYFDVLPILNAGVIEQVDLYFCSGETLPTLTVSNSTAGGTIRYQWQQSIDTGATYTNINRAVGANFSPSNLTTTTLFRRALYSNIGSGCVTNTQPVVFTFVNLNPGSLDNSQSTNICYNEVPATISNGISGNEASSNVGTISYAWQQSVDNLNWSLVPGANLSSFSPPALLQDTSFRRVAINRQGSYSCSSTTNAILISVYDEIDSGVLLGSQTICIGDLPSALTLSGTTSDSGIRYQWQMSSDNVNFSSIPNSVPTLSFPTTANWYPTSTTYYRAIIRNVNAPGCDIMSNVVEIFVAPTAEVVQLSGPGPQQTVCPGDPITNATFSLTGSATTLSATGLAGSGMSFTGPVAGVYTLRGTPTADVAITITANGINPCANASYQYNVLITAAPSRPDFIRRDANTVENTVFNNESLWYNNTLCQNTAGSTTTSFFPFELSTVVGTINYEWKAEPSAAGTINAATGVMTWNPAFSGTATISVRALGCAGNSSWLDSRFEIIADISPAVTATALTVPQALNRFFGEAETGIAPMCQITSVTPDTQYFATTASGISDYQSIRWSIENIVVGGGISGVANPGTIDPNTGVMDWNPNFFGSVDIKAEAINCAGNVDASSVTTVQIAMEDDSMPNIITVTPTIIPSCPPQGNYITSLSSNREVDWSINNDNAGFIISTATNTAEMRWIDDFSGSVRIRAEANGLCETGASDLIALVPGPAGLQTLAGLDDIRLCEADLLQDISYTITGFPSTANVTGLPDGLTGTLSATYHIIDFEYSGVPAAGQNYRLEILGQLFTYTAQAGDTADDIVVGLANEVSDLPTSNFNATRNSLNTLRLQPKVAGVSLQGTISFISGFIAVNIRTIATPQRKYILSGTLNDAAPGQYDYTITTEGGTSFCEQVSIVGKINVVGTSSLTLDIGSSDEQTICDFENITPINYTVSNAVNATVVGLPPGVVYSSSSSQVIISGRPQLNTVTTTVYTYTVSTTNNISGCLPETSRTGTLTISPNHRIALTSAIGTDNQSLCYNNGLGSITPIEYKFDGGAIQPPLISGNLPKGVVSSYDAVNNTLTISGTPTEPITTTTIYNYGVNTAGPNCSSITLSGTITLNAGPNINLSGSTDVQEVCDHESITPIQYDLENFNNAEVIGLPSGISYTANSTGVIISGAPQLNTVTTTIYTYTLRVLNITTVCSQEETRTGTLTISPNHRIALSSAIGTDNQSLCYNNGFGSITPIEYTFGGGAIQPPLISGNLPKGVVSSYDAVNYTLTISGTPTEEITTTTIYNFGVNTAGPNCSSITLSGTITLNAGPNINLSGSTDVQEVCDHESITPIQYNLENFNNAEVIGLPPGISYTANSTGVIISGTPQLNTVTTTIYTYTLRVLNITSVCSQEETSTGTLTISPNHRVALSSAIGTDNQSLCYNNGLGSITPIEYKFDGGAFQPPIISGNLPKGVVSSYDAVNNTLTISGTPTEEIMTTTLYEFGVNTAGPNCSSVTLSGTITVNPSPSIHLYSPQSTNDQTGNLAVHNNNPIQTIQFELLHSSSFSIAGLPAGVFATQSGNIITIDGTPSISSNFSQLFTFTITTKDSSCQPEASLSGQIEVIPVPQINEEYIRLNDITNVGCPGASDGAIRIPTTSPALDLRIQGGQSPVAQEEEITLINAPLLGDEYRVIINNIDYVHTVVHSSFGGPIQTVTEVRDALIQNINLATGVNESRVTASANSTSSIRLKADIAGTAFDYSADVQTTSSGSNIPTMRISQILANISTEYAYTWTGPNGFNSSSLQIENLTAGEYTLHVARGTSSSEASFIITEPEVISANNELCNGAFITTLSGGTAPYLLNLFDDLGNLIRSDATESIFTYRGLIPGASYRVEVTDASCTIPQQFSVSIPFELQFNAANVNLIHDFCQQTPNTGDGSIVLGTSSGTAFSGGSGNFSYRWSGPSGNFITRDIFNLIAGDYTVTVTDNELGCTRSETFTVASNSPLAIALSSTTVLNSNGEIEIACASSTLEEIEVNVTGGFGFYTYAWERNGVAIPNSNVNRLENLSAGVYTLTVTDVPPGGIILSNLCQLSQDFTIVSPAPLTLQVDPGDVVQAECSDQLISIPISVSGGIPPYIIELFDKSVTTSSPTFTFRDLDPTTLAETVTITLSDQNSCNAAPISLSLDLPNQYSFEGHTTNIDCLGSIQLTSTPAIPDSIVLIVEWFGDTLHYFDTWSSGNGLLDQINNPGTYTVSVSNQMGCLLYTSSFDIEDTSGEQLQVEILQEVPSSNCNENEGRIDLGISNGYPPYTIAWQMQSNTNTWTLLPQYNNQAIVTGLSSGTYRAIVSDSSTQGSNTVNCTPTITTRAIELFDQRLAIEDLQIENTADLCGEVINGKISFGLLNTLRKESISSTLSFTLDGVEPPNMTFDEVSQRYAIEDIAPGLHQLRVFASTVSTTCQFSEDFTIVENTNSVSLSFDLPNQYSFEGHATNIDCLGSIQLTSTPAIPDGVILIVEWYGDTLHYFDTWSSGNGLLDQINNPGTYTVSVSNQMGCILYTSSFDIEDTSGEQLQVEILQEVPPSSCSDNVGRIDLSISKGYPPYTIAWQMQTNTNTWTLLPQYNNQAIATGLSSGTYRAIISDSSTQGSNTVNCSPTITTRAIELFDQRLAIEDLQIEKTMDLCGKVINGKISFGLLNTLRKEEESSTLSFTLNGVEPSNITFDEIRQRYEIEDIAPGLHQLLVFASTVSTTCQLGEDFTVEEQTNPLVFNGALDYTLDICSSGVDIVIEPNDIIGGTPFEGSVPYDLHWSTFSNGTTQTFFGANINNAQAGEYVLTITDANGCQHEPVFIQVVAPEFEPFSIQGTLTHPDSTQSTPVKVLPIRCEDNEGGSIGIEVVGGLRPFEINWYVQTTQAETSGLTFRPLNEFKNQTFLTGLEPANYRVEIQSSNEMCNGSASAYTFYEEVITVEQNPDLFIVSGPFIDADICARNPGRIAVEVFNNNQGELFFYYNGEQVQVEENPQVNEQTHTLLIDSPVENATLQIINEQGCSLTKALDIRIGEPNFTFTTPTRESSNLILARENITFENISTVPYVRSEWDFGDFTPPISVLHTVTTTQVNYSYPVSGSYNVTLRIYNEAGCFLETSQRVAVGKGYSIIVPNVFSPNNDGINDLFRPLTTGLSTIRFSVYDQFGNLIYNENISEPDPSMNTGIMIQGWDGRNAPQSPFFIYTVEGVLYDGITTVERTGTFLLLR